MSDERVWSKALGGRYTRGDVIASKYQLDRVVGVGGMGVVVEATHLELQQKVAVKLLRPTRTSDDNRERFRREARAAFRLTSEHAVRILDLGQDGEILYMAMELLDGSDFGQILEAHGRLSVPTAVGYVLQVCEAVAEAHAVGVVHRDLKPENLFLCTRADGSPCVKVLDFGLAKLRDTRASLTRVNRGMGTPHYMAPEQWLSARDVGPAADIWALGVILFQLVSGARPFDDEDEGALCQSVLFADSTNLDRFVPNPPAGLPDVIMRCLEKKPKHRWRSAAELAVGLLPYAPRGPVEMVSKDSIPVPGVAASWGLSLSRTDLSGGHAGSTIVDGPRARGDRDSVTTLQQRPDFLISQPPVAGETAEAMPPSVRPGAVAARADSEPSVGEDTSEPVVGEVAAPPRAERSRVVWALAAVVVGGVAAAVLFGGVLERPGARDAEPAAEVEDAKEPPTASTGEGVVSPEPDGEPGAEEATVESEPTPEPEAIAAPSDDPVAEGGGGTSAASDEEKEAQAAEEAEDAEEEEKAPPRRRYYPRPRPKKITDIYEDI